MDLHSNDNHQVHNWHRREAKDEAIRFAVTIQLLRHREHLHAAVDQRRHTEQSSTDHRNDQVADVVSRHRHKTEDCGNDAEKVGILPLIGGGYNFVWNQAQLAHCYLKEKEWKGQLICLSWQSQGLSTYVLFVVTWAIMRTQTRRWTMLSLRISDFKATLQHIKKIIKLLLNNRQKDENIFFGLMHSYRKLCCQNKSRKVDQWQDYKWLFSNY